jgi:hypothetical protein
MKTPGEMGSSVVQQTLSWVAWLFRVPVASLDNSKKFGLDLKPSPESFYGKETLDVVTEDVMDMEKALKEVVLEKTTSLTVGDFCGLVERLNKVNPAGCQRLLRSWQRIVIVDKKPKWRRMLFKTFGF